MRKILAALIAATVPLALVAQQVAPQFGLDKTGTDRRVTVYDPTKPGADKMVPMGSLDASNIFTPANIKTVNGNIITGSGNVGVGTVTSVGALTIGTTGTDIGSSVTNGTTTPAITLNVPSASASNRGALTAADFSTFAAKQAALVSGTNIKTVGGVSLLGAGDIGTLGVAYGGTGVTSSTGSGSNVLSNSPTLVTPALGTPSAIVLTNATGTASGLTAGNVTTNANLTGVITSVGNATSIASQTGTGTKFVVDTSPTLVTPNLGTPSAGVLTNATGLPIGTGLTGLGAANRIPVASSATALTTSSNFLWNGTTLSVGSTSTNSSYAAIVKRATDANFGIGLQGSELTLEAFNDAISANVPMRLYASTLGIYTGGTQRFQIDANGGVGIGTPSAGISLRINRNVTGATSAYGTYSDGAVQSDVTSLYGTYLSNLTTAAASFTLGSAFHFRAQQSTIGAGSAVTNQYGFYADSSLTGATNNYAYYGGIAAGTNRYNLFMTGTAQNYLAGSLGLGVFPVSNVVLINGKNITGGSVATGQLNYGTVQSDVTSTAYYYRSLASSAAASYTTSLVKHFSADQATFGAGSTITAQMGFVADATLVGGVSNYGYFGDIAAGSGRWNIYMNGTANNYVGGSLGMGTTSLSAVRFYNALPITGGNNGFGNLLQSTIQSDVTTQAFGYKSILHTQAAAFTNGLMAHFAAEQGTIGSGSTVTTQIAYRSEASLIGAGFNVGLQLENTAAVTSGKIAYGIVNKINVATGGGTTWGYYGEGNAPNYFAGDMRLDKTITAAGTTGAQTINKNAGSVNFAAAATSLVVTNDRVTANSIIQCTVAANDNTLKSVACVPGSGSFTMYGNAAANAETRVNFLVVN